MKIENEYIHYLFGNGDINYGKVWDSSTINYKL